MTMTYTAPPGHALLYDANGNPISAVPVTPFTVGTLNQPSILGPSQAVSEQAQQSAPWEELGRTGTQLISGMLWDEEYNPDLQGEKAIKVYDEMRADGQIAALLRVCKLPLIQAEWSVKPASEEPDDVEVGQFVQDNLFGGLDRTWQAVIDHALTMEDYGFSIFEKVYQHPDESPDGYIRLKKLAPRQAKTVERWYVNQDDELDRVRQRPWIPDPSGAGGQHKVLIIPADKLVRFTLDQRGNNFQGVSLLRAAYKHWYYKNKLMFLDAMRIERGQGIPVIREPQGAQPADRLAASKSMESLHAHEKNYLQIPFGWDVSTFGLGSASTIDPGQSMDYHDLQIARSVLAQFINLSGGGSQALSRDHSSFFLMSLKSIAEVIKSVFDKRVIRPLVDLNFTPPHGRYPTLEVEMSRRDLDEMGGSLANLAGSLLLTPTLETENSLRKALNFPDVTAEEWQAAHPLAGGPLAGGGAGPFGQPTAPVGQAPPTQAIDPLTGAPIPTGSEWEAPIQQTVDTDSQGYAGAPTPEDALRYQMTGLSEVRATVQTLRDQVAAALAGVEG